LPPLSSCFRHLKVGRRFQAEIPELQDRSHLEEEEAASLVWKPGEDIVTSPESPDRGFCDASLLSQGRS